MKPTLFTLIALFFSVAISAQNITGKVTDTQNQPIEFANIVLMKNDSIFISGTSSDLNGSFSLAMPQEKGNYNLMIKCIGFDEKSMPIHYQENNVNMGNITLTTSSYQLAELVVKANRVQKNPGGYFVNLKGEELAKGKQTLELLKFLPGITSQDGELNVLGQKISVIYLDGVRINNQKELEAIPAEMLQSAQIDYMAGSSESAGEKGAVIHIKLAKQPEGGYYGSILGGGSIMTKYGYNGEYASSTFSYRYKKLSIFNSLLYNRQKTVGDFETYRILKETGTETKSTEELRSWNSYLYDRFSLTYDLTDNKTIGTSFFFSTDDANPINKVISTDITDNISTQHKTIVESPFTHDIYQVTTKYNWVTDDKGSEFAVAVDYLRNNEKENMKATFTNDTFSDISENYSRQNTNMYKGDISFNKRFNSGYALNTGVDYRFIQTNYTLSNEYNSYGKSKSSGQMPSVYSEFSGSINKLQYQLGVRVQQNKIRYEVPGTDIDNSNSQWGIFPSVNLMYMLNPEKGHLFMLVFKRSIEDIPYSAISPYKNFTSNYFYTTGNPDLISPKQNMLLAVFDLFNSITLNGMYMHTLNQIYFATEIDSDNPLQSYTIPKNGKSESTLGIGLEGRADIAKWWKLKVSARYMSYSANTELYNVKNQSKYFYSINNSFVFSKNCGATLEAYYEPTSHFRDRIFHSVYDVNGSLYKKFINDKLEARLNFKLFRKGRVLETNTPEQLYITKTKTNEQYFRLSLTYFFKGGKSVNVKNTTSIQDYNKIEDIK